MSATMEALTFRGSTGNEAEFDEVTPTSYAIRKRPFVRLGGVILGVVLIPMIAILVVLVRLMSPGPGLYRQRRVGLHGKEFTIYKIRSMRNDAEKLSGPVWAAKKDPRVTPLGRFLRYSHLDELPQIINVIRGEMDFVGPRPERPEIVEEILPLVDGYQSRHTVLPGITGLAQVNLEPDQRIECVQRKVAADCFYIEHATFWYDLRLIFATLLRVPGLRYHRGARLLRVTLPADLASFGVRRALPESLDDTHIVAAYACDTVVDRPGGPVAVHFSRSEARVPR